MRKLFSNEDFFQVFYLNYEVRIVLVYRSVLSKVSLLDTNIFRRIPWIFLSLNILRHSSIFSLNVFLNYSEEVTNSILLGLSKTKAELNSTCHTHSNAHLHILTHTQHTHTHTQKYIVNVYKWCQLFKGGRGYWKMTEVDAPGGR